MLTEGHDADIVLWDSHPLQIGATPAKVWIDGVVQIPIIPRSGEDGKPVDIGVGKEAPRWREVPPVPNWDDEREKAIEWEGLPPLGSRFSSRNRVVFTNVADIWSRNSHNLIQTKFSAEGVLGMVVVEDGKIICSGTSTSCASSAVGDDYTAIDLAGGSLSPSLMTFGSSLGVEEIQSEPSTGNGMLNNALIQNLPKIFGDAGGVVKALDALVFGTRNAL